VVTLTPTSFPLRCWPVAFGLVELVVSAAAAQHRVPSSMGLLLAGWCRRPAYGVVTLGFCR
jgi:hypothetical protein